MMNTMDKFEVQIMSDEDYEDLIAEVMYDGECCCVVTQEDGFEHLKVAIHARSNGEPWNFAVDELQRVLAKARDQLWRLRKVQE